jgi:hypothetical protein
VVLLEDGTNRFSQNVGKGLLFDTAKHPRRVQIPSTSWQKPEITNNAKVHPDVSHIHGSVEVPDYDI